MMITGPWNIINHIISFFLSYLFLSSLCLPSLLLFTFFINNTTSFSSFFFLVFSSIYLSIRFSVNISEFCRIPHFVSLNHHIQINSVSFINNILKKRTVCLKHLHDSLLFILEFLLQFNSPMNNNRRAGATAAVSAGVMIVICSCSCLVIVGIILIALGSSGAFTRENWGRNNQLGVGAPVVTTQPTTTSRGKAMFLCFYSRIYMTLHTTEFIKEVRVINVRYVYNRDRGWREKQRILDDFTGSNFIFHTLTSFPCSLFFFS